jgi:DNA-binding IclR family transcriptional regulator
MIRFLDCAESAQPVRVGYRTGTVRPAHVSAVGKAILAWLPVSELRRRYPDDEPGPGTSAVTISLQALESELALIREQRYALNWEETTEGISAVAVALRDAAGFPLASISIAAPSSRTRSIEGIRAFAPAVLRAAEMVQQRLDAPG